MLEAFAPARVRIVDSLDAASFARDILPSAQPVLVKGLNAAWPAVQKAQQSDQVIVDYLRAMDRGAPVSVLEANAKTQGRFAYAADMNEFNFNRRSKTITAGMEQILGLRDNPDAPFVYVQSTPVAEHLPAFIADNPSPLLPPQITPRIWISNATRAQTHNDQDHNIACVVAGRRTFTLFPPEQVKNLYIGPMEHTPSGRAISLASLEEPDFERFPRLREAIAHAQVAEMEPGDALYVPKYWWHHVQSHAAFNILINYWWGNSASTADNPLAPFLAGLVALKDLSDADRSYWKAMFDFYVFRTEGDPVDHIPPNLQGALGRHTPKLHADLIRALQALVNGR